MDRATADTKAFAPDDGRFRHAAHGGLALSAMGRQYLLGSHGPGSEAIDVGQRVSLSPMDWLEVRSVATGEVERRLERPSRIGVGISPADDGVALGFPGGRVEIWPTSP